MDTVKLKHLVESLGCNVKRENTGYFIMLPINFPWYGKLNKPRECDNSRIIAYATTAFGTFKWMDAWTIPDIRKNPLNGKPFGVEMRKDAHFLIETLRSFNEEELAAWLERKIGEVSQKTKEYHKLALTLEAKGEV